MSTQANTWIAPDGGLLVWCQSVGTAVITLVMRRFGIGLELADGPSRKEAVRQRLAEANHLLAVENRPLQFSLLNLLVWTTAAAPVLAILRVADWVFFRYANHDIGVLHGATLGVIMSMLSVVAMWSALGRGSIWSRIAVLLALVPTIGLITSVLSLWISPWYSSRGPGMRVSDFLHLADIGVWISWV